MLKTGIFIFTKDRVDTFNLTLNLVGSSAHKVFIIDDSHLETNRLINKQLAIGKGCRYLGKTEFVAFTEQYNINLPEYSFLLREPGDHNWNLGYARNFALLYSRAIKLNRVLFMDDDIQVPNLDLIEELYEKKANYQFVGANILGLVDDSVLGHIATDIGIMNERMLSGGFMVYDPFEIDHFFLNNYNEDWIWLFLQLAGKVHLQTGNVHQTISNPLANYENKILFQEFGEIALDGILDLYPTGRYESLAMLEFWQRMLDERKQYLNTLSEIANTKGRDHYKEIVDYVKSRSETFKAVIFKDLFKKYFENRETFQSLYNALS